MTRIVPDPFRLVKESGFSGNLKDSPEGPEGGGVGGFGIVEFIQNERVVSRTEEGWVRGFGADSSLPGVSR